MSMFVAKFLTFLGILVAFQAAKLVLIYAIRRPKNIAVFGLPTVFGKWISGVLGLLRSPQITLAAHLKAPGKPFAIPTLTNYHICISDLNQIAEVSNAPSHQLSFNDFLAESIYPKYTMEGWQYDAQDPHNKISVSALKNGLRSNLPAVRPILHEILKVAFNEETTSKQDERGWINISAAAVGHRVAGNLNARVILGEKLASDRGNVEAALQYAWDAAITTEVMRFTPSILQDPIAFLTMRWSGASRKLERRVSSLVEERLRPLAIQMESEKPLDCIQWMIDAAKKQKHQEHVDVRGITQRTLGFLFAAAHQTPMLTTFALYNLCKHPEYLIPLRREVSRLSKDDVCGCRNDQAPLLDSFLKETARLFPLQTIVMDRKVMHSFTFSDGTCVPAGNCICVPQQALMLDHANYSDPSEFQGFRYVNRKPSEDEAGGEEWQSTSRLTHPSAQFPFWGSVARACPARFYVSMIAKMIIIHLIEHYDVKVADGEPTKPYFAWGSNMVPHPGLKLLIKRRNI